MGIRNCWKDLKPKPIIGQRLTRSAARLLQQPTMQLSDQSKGLCVAYAGLSLDSDTHAANFQADLAQRLDAT